MAKEFEAKVIRKIATLSSFQHGQTTKELRLIEFPAGRFLDLRIWKHYPDGTERMTQHGITINDEELARLKQAITEKDGELKSTYKESEGSQHA